LVSGPHRCRSVRPTGVVACCRPRLRVTCSPGVDDVAGVAILGLPARVEEPFLSRRAPRVGGALSCAARVHRGLGALRTPSSRALPCWRMRDAELSACWTAACSMSTCASRCRFRASGVEGAGMARSSAATAMSFWLARGGVSGSSMLKSVLMRSRACLPNSRARSPRAEASPAIEAGSNRTVWYSSASLASSSRAWASCALMSAALGGEGGGALAPQPGAVQFPEQEEPLRRRHPPRRRRLLGRWRLRRSTPARGHSSQR
jgi:hypothetical protein